MSPITINVEGFMVRSSLDLDRGEQLSRMMHAPGRALFTFEILVPDMEILELANLGDKVRITIEGID